MNYTVKIIDKSWLTHNVMLLVFEKPQGFTHNIGQAIELTLNSRQFRNQFAPFTLVGSPEEKHLRLIIKVYPKHKGLTEALSKAKISDSLLITDAWDSYVYKGKGTFIAAGSGITPFLPMFWDLKNKNVVENHQLIYANRMTKDIILKDELNLLFKEHYYNILSEEQSAIYDYGRIDYAYLVSKIRVFDQYFYVCGPDAFMESVRKDLIRGGAKEDNIQTGY
ncbi:flavodoxin reductase [Arenibacter sp. S6351L]|uniref:flavodoxin reductase n=1 Tax=Arenibacter sp. S6351L TaxID=2926407 RepID=UPI001FF47146|nr:flavodoxin reductase [Arenibacter sp. S6351L]MCK0134748.1 flavodoxin reductase [Arenibacter sp. S6351L]